MTLPPTTWSVTGKRGRHRRAVHCDHVVTPDEEDRDVALFLLSLASSATASDLCLDGIASPTAAGVGDQQRLRWMTKNKRMRKKERAEVAGAPKWRPQVYECELCPGRFPTAQAVGGHTKNRLEGDVRGRLVKKKTRKISSLAFDSGLSFNLKPSDRSSLSPFASSTLEGKRAQEEEDDAGGKHPSSLFC